MTRGGLEKGFEQGDDFLLHKVDEALERWENRLTLSRPRFLERYEKLELSIHVHTPENVGPQKFCAIFERAPSLLGGIVDESLDDTRTAYHYSRLPNGTTDQVQDAMLISVVQLIQEPQWVRRDGLSIVRLQPLDKCAGRPGDLLYFSFTRGFVFVRVFEDRKGRSLVRSLPIRQNKLVHQMIKRGSKVMDAISNDQSPADWRRVSDDRSPHNPISGLGVILSNDAIGLRTHEIFDEHRDALEVLFGPFNLHPNRIKGTGHVD